jgi:tetratricopeptide (TPR) repeat protein
VVKRLLRGKKPAVESYIVHHHAMQLGAAGEIALDRQDFECAIQCLTAAWDFDGQIIASGAEDGVRNLRHRLTALRLAETYQRLENVSEEERWLQTALSDWPDYGPPSELFHQHAMKFASAFYRLGLLRLASFYSGNVMEGGWLEDVVLCFADHVYPFLNPLRRAHTPEAFYLMSQCLQKQAVCFFFVGELKEAEQALQSAAGELANFEKAMEGGRASLHQASSLRIELLQDLYKTCTQQGEAERAEAVARWLKEEKREGAVRFAALLQAHRASSDPN